MRDVNLCFAERDMYVSSRQTSAFNQFWRTVMGEEYTAFKVPPGNDVINLMTTLHFFHAFNRGIKILMLFSLLQSDAIIV